MKNIRNKKVIIGLVVLAIGLIASKAEGLDFGAADFVRRYSANSHITNIPFFFKVRTKSEKRTKKLKAVKPKKVRPTKQQVVKNKRIGKVKNQQAKLKLQIDAIQSKIQKLNGRQVKLQVAKKA